MPPPGPADVPPALTVGAPSNDQWQYIGIAGPQAMTKSNSNSPPLSRFPPSYFVEFRKGAKKIVLLAIRTGALARDCHRRGRGPRGEMDRVGV